MESVELVEYLLKNGANPHKTDNLGLSALDDACLIKNTSAKIQDSSNSINDKLMNHLEKCTKIVEILENHVRPKFE